MATETGRSTWVGEPDHQEQAIGSPFLDGELFVSADAEDDVRGGGRPAWYQSESPFISALEPSARTSDAYRGEREAEAPYEPDEERYPDARDGEEPEGRDGSLVYEEAAEYSEEFDEEEEGGAERVWMRAPPTGTDALSEALAELNSELEGEEEEGGQLAQGLSPLAIQAKKQWDAPQDRPKAWRGQVYGLVVHTSGGGLPASARDQGIYHTARAVNYYSQSHGCHYINGWRGVGGGDLLQIANEREQAHGVGVTNPKEPSKDQRRSIDAGRFEQDLPAIVVRLWRARWPGYRDSLALLPGTKTANACYVHMECIPCVYHYNGKLLADAAVLRNGLRFTKAQHDTVALLACDIARRNGWPADQAWWRTPRLLGHEDLTPITRHDRLGGWDPGYLREKPYFDWDYVYQMIETLQKQKPGGATLPTTGGGGFSIVSALGDLAKRFGELVSAGQELMAVQLAYQRGVRDRNKLTNLLFFARHPELGGRAIRPDETGLAREWLEIRDKVVNPTLVSLARATAVPHEI